MDQLAGDYRIDIFTDYAPRATWKLGGVPAQERDSADLAAFIAILNTEFRKYPKTFIHSTHWGAIVLVKHLSVDGQLRGAVPDYGQQVLWLDFKGYQHRPEYQRHIIHHEFYHLIDFELNGDAYWADPAWLALKNKAFKYGKGGAGAYADKTTSWFALFHPALGFVNRYSMLGVEEDKAEIFAPLFLKSERMKLGLWMRSDPVLKAKVNAIKNIVVHFDPAMNAGYWQSLS